MKLSSYLLVLVPMFVSACFGGGEKSPSQRLCAALSDCGQIQSDRTDECEVGLEADLAKAPVRALEECLQCIESEQCSSIERGACATQCDDIDTNQDKAEPETETGTITVTKDGIEVCGLKGWTGAWAKNTGGTFAVDTRCGDLSLDIEYPAVGLNGSTTCNDISLSGTSQRISCADYRSTFTGSATVTEVDGVVRLKGSCNCFDETDGTIRVRLDVELR